MVNTLHIFFDKGGFFSNNVITKLNNEKHHFFYHYFKNEKFNNLNQHFNHDHSKFPDILIENDIKKIYFHSLHYFQIKLLKIIPSNIDVHWIFWSYEFYQLPFNLKFLYAQNNKTFFYRKYISTLYETFLNSYKFKILPWYIFSKKNYIKQLKRVDFFHTFIEDDYIEIFKDSINKPVFSFHSYLDKEEVNSYNLNKEKEVVMIGHSASPLQNHLEIINKFSNCNFKGNLLFVLAYGNNNYKKQLLKILSNQNNLMIETIQHKIPFEEYNNKISSVSHFILNTYCQQGLGNIVFFLLNKTTIYLNPKSTTYNFLKRKGFFVFSTDEINLKAPLQSISEQQALKNMELTADLLATKPSNQY